MSIPLPEIESAARALGRQLTQQEAQGLARYLSLLSLWNTRMNLVGARHWRAMLELAQDSWHVADVLHRWDQSPRLTLDLGAGAGLPGIPLRLFWDQGTYVLVEPRHKRSVFLRQAVVELGLSRTKVAACRMEELPPELRHADLVLARAFLPPPELLAAARSVLRPGGTLLLMTRQNLTLPNDYVLAHTHTYTARAQRQQLLLVTWRGHEGGNLG
ncbi:ribosomal RNA small subunit methyltransferase G [Thermodesulfomicrobium sp. WS]|uniref:16S rRNA (guanine(527)-N(7))-methyltransferase RsmG n=1 Tax=Thermodesulfomicrobium sp. WS TaxID=3004129 RepID=UPI0024904907|nr:16S rRNA (guanine(527)-N(7))-methyltransferase RsmG [Thermodesulfomicrobium sp. WS]BDV01356.1 ribosomal RNA small subunit methyltransferase G [Thermodesulfomicrobium sp. WS]